MKPSGFFLSILLVLFSVCVFGDSQVPSKGIVTAQHGLNFRTGPGTQYPVISTLPEGTEVRITDFSGRWYKIRMDQQEGYCFARYIRVTEHTPANEDDAARIPHVTLDETDPLKPPLNAVDLRIVPQSDFSQ